ncbi:hypothetical protein [Halomarina litorea]|uniref:hypothetical protein n=1 Tax=Halomarina litorea TaxID=2961595 RepID=UPI0020C290E8|nr:hypothetical protein [Halomarina sp. BCD28]
MSSGKALAALVGLVGAVSIHDHLTTSKHDRVVRKTAKSIEREAPEATLHVDHESGVGNGQPDTIERYRPDITVRDFPRFLAIEIETRDSLDTHASEQLEAFASKRNYTAVLVVPSSTVPVAEEFVENRVDADVRVATPSNVV